MPHKIFSVMMITVATFLVLTLIAVVFSSLADDTIIDIGGILQFDKTLLVKLAIQWFNILLLTFVLIRVLYNPVRKFMIDRADRIKNDINSARKTNQEAQEHKASYEKLLAGIEKEREEILVKAHREAVEEHDRILADAQKEAKMLLMRAAEEIKIERENAADDIRRQIIEISTLMATRFVQVSIDSQTQDKYIDEALEDWRDRTW